MTSEQRTKLYALKAKLTEHAVKVGPLHAYWEIIFDLDAFLNDKETFVQMTADEWIAYVEGHILEDYPEI